jgi:hypothetical protein
MLLWLLFFLPLAAFAEERICGTRWLEEHRDEFSDPAAKALTSLQQEGPIKVGTALNFFVPTRVVGGANATCRYVSENCYIFVEDSQWEWIVAQPDVDQLGRVFDDSTSVDPERGIFELAVEAFGEPADVDGDPRIFVLLLDMPDENIVGYFSRKAATLHQLELRRDTIYLNALKANFNKILAWGTLAHELQHLIHWGHDPDEERWIDEGLSGYAEELTGFTETDPSMVPSFLDSTTFINFATEIWPNFPRSVLHYGATFLFASFLAERYGSSFIRTLVDEPRNGIFGIDDAFEAENWDQRYEDVWALWIAANYAANDPSFGYSALQGRRARADPAPAVPFGPIGGGVGSQWGTTNVIIRSVGDVEVDFVGAAEGRYAVWVYAMYGGGGEMVRMELNETNEGQVQVVGVDSVAVVIGRSSRVGSNFTLAARHFVPTAVAMETGVLPSANTLEPAYPNPFNSAVALPFRLGREADVELAIYNALGQRQALLVSDRLGAGTHQAHWDGRRAASGVYLAVLRVGGETRMRRLTLVK